MVEQLTCNHQVASSIPVAGTICGYRIMAITSAFQSDDAGSIPATRSRFIIRLASAGLFFKCLTIQTVDSCLFCGEFVKRNWHGESPCAEGQSATGVLSPTLILSVRVQVLILNSPGGTRHHAMAHSATLQPLSGGAVYIDFVRCE